MKKTLLLIGAAFVMLLSSCSEKEYTDVIPRGSTALMSIDLQQTGTDVLQSKVSDDDKLEGIVNDLSEKGVCQKITQRKGIRFTMVKEAWMMGFDDQAVMLMGPIASAQQTQIQQQIGRYLKQDERQGVTESKMFQKLDSIHSAMALVTQVAALPEQFTAPFMLGAPKTADASQVLLEAELQVQDQMLVIQGQTFSFNQQIDKDLQETATLFRPMEGAFLNRLGTRTALSFLTNVEGKRFLPVLQQNKGLQSLLTGAKFTIDINEVINSVEGDMLLSFSSFGDGNGRMTMHAQRGEKSDYYYSNKEETEPEQSSQPLTELLGGQRLAMVLQLNALGDEFAATVSGFLKPLFGDLSTIVYVMCVPEKGNQQE